MKFSDLRKKIEHNYPYYDFNPAKETLTCTWSGMLEPQVYKAVMSADYKKLAEECGFESFIDKYTTYKEEGDILVLDPKFMEKGLYLALEGRRRGKNGDSSCDLALFYDGNKINTDFSQIPYYYRSCCYGIDEPIGIYKDCLVYFEYDACLMVNKTGQVGFVCEYPNMSESGKIKVRIDGDNLLVSEYVYYDNDHHHGGWEETGTSLSKVKDQLDKQFQSELFLNGLGTSLREFTEVLTDIEKKWTLSMNVRTKSWSRGEDRSDKFSVEKQLGDLVIRAKGSIELVEGLRSPQHFITITLSDKDRTFEIEDKSSYVESSIGKFLDQLGAEQEKDMEDR